MTLNFPAALFCQSLQRSSRQATAAASSSSCAKTRKLGLPAAAAHSAATRRWRMSGGSSGAQPTRQLTAAAVGCGGRQNSVQNNIARVREHAAATAASRQLVCTSAFLAQLARRWRQWWRWRRQQAHHCTGHSWHSLSGILHGLYVMIRVQYLVLEPCFARTYYVAQEVHKELHTWRRRPRQAQARLRVHCSTYFA